MIVKVRNTLFKKAHLYAPNVQREFHYFEGELVATPKWVTYDAIALSTGLKKFPVRIIAKADVVEMDGKASALKEAEVPEMRTFSITGSKGDVYTVNIGNKHSDCTCAAFQFRRSCKHIKEANERLLDI
jgi:hypothetical protein